MKKKKMKSYTKAAAAAANNIIINYKIYCIQVQSQCASSVCRQSNLNQFQATYTKLNTE